MQVAKTFEEAGLGTEKFTEKPSQDFYEKESEINYKETYKIVPYPTSESVPNKTSDYSTPLQAFEGRIISIDFNAKEFVALLENTDNNETVEAHHPSVLIYNSI